MRSSTLPVKRSDSGPFEASELELWRRWGRGAGDARGLADADAAKLERLERVLGGLGRRLDTGVTELGDLVGDVFLEPAGEGCDDRGRGRGDTVFALSDTGDRGAISPSQVTATSGAVLLRLDKVSIKPGRVATHVSVWGMLRNECAMWQSLPRSVYVSFELGCNPQSIPYYLITIDRVVNIQTRSSSLLTLLHCYNHPQGFNLWSPRRVGLKERSILAYFGAWNSCLAFNCINSTFLPHFLVLAMSESQSTRSQVCIIFGLT